MLVIVEAMKMENEIARHAPGVVSDLASPPGDAVRTGQALLASARRDRSGHPNASACCCAPWPPG